MEAHGVVLALERVQVDRERGRVGDREQLPERRFRWPKKVSIGAWSIGVLQGICAKLTICSPSEVGSQSPVGAIGASASSQ